MKKLITLLTLIALSAPALAADQYASVDVDKVFRSYKKTTAVNEDFQKQEADIRVFIVDAQKSVVGATNEADRKKLEDKYSKELKDKMDKLQKGKIAALKGIETDIKKVIDAEGKKGTYALILSSSNTLYGAVDITDSIIKALNGN